VSEFVAERRVDGAAAPVLAGMERLSRWFSVGLTRRRRSFALILLVIMFIIAALAPRIFVTVPSGRAGVLWLRFFGGTRLNTPALDEGLHIIFPWDRIFIYDMRLQERGQTYDVIAHDGLQFSINISFRWRLNRNSLPYLHRDIGPNYLNSLLIPEIGSVMRERASVYETEDLYATRRAQLQREIREAIISPDNLNRIGTNLDSSELDSSVVLYDVLIKDIKLPDRVRMAIERKLEQAQISQEYTFRLAREHLETERKRIEAQGIQAFQQTVQAGISENYLKWRGIEATLQLAASQNAKVVIIGNNSQGLPLILNTGDSPAVGGPRAAAAASRTSSVQDTDAESAGQIGGSIDMAPPKPNPVGSDTAVRGQTESPPEGAGPPAAAPDQRHSAEDPRARERQAGGPAASSDTPPSSILQSLVAPFGYRLERSDSPPGWSMFTSPIPRR
jgi:regulator of protease activity HflC (stomatin/prohibitin superfamily)